MESEPEFKYRRLIANLTPSPRPIFEGEDVSHTLNIPTLRRRPF